MNSTINDHWLEDAAAFGTCGEAAVVDFNPSKYISDSDKIIEEISKNTQMILAKIDANLYPKKEIYIRIDGHMTEWPLERIEKLVQKVVDLKLARHYPEIKEDLRDYEIMNNYEKLYGLLKA
jgi:hypothetical protein